MRRLPALLLALAAGGASLTACASGDDTAATPTSTVTVTQSVAPSTPASSDESSETGSVDQPVPAPQATEVVEDTPSADDVCTHATEAELMSALRQSADNRRVAYPPRLNRIRCAEPFAVASTVGTVQSSSILFRYQGGEWLVLEVGSAIPYDRFGLTEDQKNTFIVGR